MTKKVIRILITVCLILTLTSNTAYATANRNVYFDYSISSNDQIVTNCSEDDCNAHLSGHVFVFYNQEYKHWEIRFIEATLTMVNTDENSYTYLVQYCNDYHSSMDVLIKKGAKEIGCLHFNVTYKGNFYRQVINESNE